MFHQSGSPPALPMHTSARQHPKSPSWSLPSKNVPPADISPVAQNAPAQLSRGFSGGASDSDGDESWGIADEIAAPASAANAPQSASFSNIVWLGSYKERERCANRWSSTWCIVSRHGGTVSIALGKCCTVHALTSISDIDKLLCWVIDSRLPRSGAIIVDSRGDASWPPP
jgi:hypothetical protein